MSFAEILEEIPNLSFARYLGIAALVLAVGSATLFASEGSSWSWGPTENQLRMGVAIDHFANPKTSTDIRIRFENVGKDDLTLNLGIALGNNRFDYPQSLSLLVTDSSGNTQKLEYSYPPFIEGRVDPFVVPIPAGSAFEIRSPLDHFMSVRPLATTVNSLLDARSPLKRLMQLEPAGITTMRSLMPGTYKFAVEMEARPVTEDRNGDLGGLEFMPYWTGSLLSGEISISLP